MTKMLICLLLAAALLEIPGSPEIDDPDGAYRAARENGKVSEEVFRRTQKMLHAWLAVADPRTFLLPDFIPGYKRGKPQFDLYTPHNSGADNYPYLVATAFFTDPALFRGRMVEMLRAWRQWHDQHQPAHVDPLARIACDEPPGFVRCGQELRARVRAGSLVAPAAYRGRWA